MKLLKKLTIVFDCILNGTAVFSGILLIFAMVSVGVAVFSRYFLGRPIGWVTEIGAYILLYITFLVAAWVLKGEGHITIDALLNRLKPRTQSLYNAITSAICTIVCVIPVWYGAKVTWELYQTNYYTPTILEIPKFIVIIIICLGSFLLFIQFLRRTYDYLRSYRGLEDSKKEAGEIHKPEI